MKEYKVERSDHYLVRVKAKNKKEARKLINTEDYYLNSGDFMESTFGKLEED